MARNYGAPFKTGASAVARAAAEAAEDTKVSDSGDMDYSERQAARFGSKGVAGLDDSEFVNLSPREQRLSKGSGKAGPNEY